jgi:hypothetical protein
MEKGDDIKMNDINTLVTYLVTPVGMVALIIALAEVAKNLGVNKKYIPLLDLVIGLIGSFFIYQDLTMVYRVLVGIALGLSACGLFSGVKNTYESFKEV